MKRALGEDTFKYELITEKLLNINMSYTLKENLKFQLENTKQKPSEAKGKPPDKYLLISLYPSILFNLICIFTL